MVNRRVGNMARERSSSRGGFQYKAPPPGFVKKQSERKVSRFDSIFKSGYNSWIPESGDNRIRILPATWDDHEDYAYPVWVHKYVGSTQSNYLCLDKMLGKRCPICEEANAARKAKDDEEASRNSAKEGFVIWMLDRDDKAAPPQLHLLGVLLYKDINTLANDTDSGGALLIDQPDEGYDIRIRRNGSGLNTKYFPMLGRQCPILEDEGKQAKLLRFLEENPIPDCLEFKDAKYLEKIMSGTTGSGDEELDDEDDTAEDDVRPKAKSRRRDDDEEEEELEERAARRDREAEEENEGREARSAKRSKSRRDEDEEEEPEERPRTKRRAEPEEEDEPPPKRRGKSRASEEDEDDEPSRGNGRAYGDDDNSGDDNDDSPPPRRKGSRRDDNDDDRPRARRR